MSVKWLECLELGPINNEVRSMKLLHTKNRKKDVKNEQTFTSKPTLYKFKNVKTFFCLPTYHSMVETEVVTPITMIILPTINY